MCEVIATGAGDRYHRDGCEALKAGREGGEVQGHRMHGIRRFASAGEAEAAGWTACAVCMSEDDA